MAVVDNERNLMTALCNYDYDDDDDSDGDDKGTLHVHTHTQKLYFSSHNLDNFLMKKLKWLIFDSVVCLYR